MSAPPRIKLFVAILAQSSVDQAHTTSLFAEVFGSVDYIGPQRSFDCTQYYEEDKGPGLVRWLISFTGPYYADILPGAKRACIELERGYAVAAEKGATDTGSYTRSVNLDIGYLDRHKVVLASTKEAGHKIYLDDSIYGDLLTRYSNNTWHPLPWCFPDFAAGRYNEELSTIREIFMRG
jgi:hypothetical protein